MEYGEKGCSKQGGMHSVVSGDDCFAPKNFSRMFLLYRGLRTLDRGRWYRTCPIPHRISSLNSVGAYPLLLMENYSTAND